MKILLAAFALMLVLEGMLPFIAPSAWRAAFKKMTELGDAQLRVLGLSSMLFGLLLLMLI